MNQQPCAKDCPRRAPGCGATCKDWYDYVAERDAKYKERLTRHTADQVLYEGMVRYLRKYHKKKRK